MFHSLVVVAAWLALHGAPQEPRAATQQVFAVSGVVDDVDRVGRTITIKSGGTTQAPIYVGPDLPIFDQLNRGDTVTVSFHDSYIVDVTPGARMTPPSNTTADAKRELDRADADVIQQTKLVVTVDEIDAANRVVTYHGFDNRRVLRQVQHPTLLEGLKVGDVVTITYTRARAAAIEKAQ
jgi:Cu/Ag efflux protein CusF